MIHVEEILIYYRQYKIFMSDYIKNCTVYLLPETNMEVHQDKDTSELDLANDIIEERECPFLQRNSAHNTVTT